MFHRRSALLILVLDLNRNVNELTKPNWICPSAWASLVWTIGKVRSPLTQKLIRWIFIPTLSRSSKSRIGVGKNILLFVKTRNTTETFVPDIWQKFRRRWPWINSAALLAFAKASLTLDWSKGIHPVFKSPLTCDPLDHSTTDSS